jgi:hypothetical protein
MKIKWEYLNNEARADHNGLALFARPGSAFIMRGRNGNCIDRRQSDSDGGGSVGRELGDAGNVGK